MTKNKTVMQYVKKPSLAAMRTFLTTPSFEYQLPYPENAYCGKLLRGAIKAGISAPKLLMGIESAEKYLIEAWQKFSGKDHAIFASDNFIVCGVNPQGKLKIAFIDI
jgi:hypothetical protein